MRPADLPTGIVLSVCVRCRDGREDAHDEVRGGVRLAGAVANAVRQDQDGLPAFEVRGVRCISQCKRPCTVSVTAAGAFTWLFGDLDPERHAQDVLGLVWLYAQSPGGFMGHDSRPEPMQAGVLGRLPPVGSSHEIVEPLLMVTDHRDAPGRPT